jgi:hypothetical protein
METAVLSEHHVRFKTVKLNLHPCQLYLETLKPGLQRHGMIVPRLQLAHHGYLALFQVLTLHSPSNEPTDD